METQTATFVCEVSKPNQEAEWFKNGKKIQSNGRVEIQVDETKHLLIIRDALTKDEAEYTVNIKDKSSKGNLFVEGVWLDINSKPYT